MNLQALIWGVVGFLLTLMVLSYLIGDNFFFRLAANLFVGITAGYLAILISKQILWPYLLKPLVGGTLYQRLWVLIPVVLSLFLIFSQFAQLRRLGRIPLAFLAGLTAALLIGGAIFGTLVPQLSAVVANFDVPGWYATPDKPWIRITESVLMLVGVIGTLSYFHFGRGSKRKPGGLVNTRPQIFEILSKVGEVFIGLALGAVFAGIFSSALLAMIDRIAFLGDWITRWVGGG
jgi:hypothetical protein